jgi:hypothetical protein
VNKRKPKKEVKKGNRLKTKDVAVVRYIAAELVNRKRFLLPSYVMRCLPQRVRLTFNGSASCAADVEAVHSIPSLN